MNDLYQIYRWPDKKAWYHATKEVIATKRLLWNGLRDIENAPFKLTKFCELKFVQSIKKNTACIRTTPGLL